MVGISLLDFKKQPAALAKPRKSLPVQSGSLDSLVVFSSKRLASSATGDFSYATFRKPSRPHVRVNILAATQKQGGQLPWR